VLAPEQPVVLPTHFQTDDRGVFSKPFAAASSALPSFDVREIYWTSSVAGAIRGMHFQTPPFACSKLIWVSRGAIVDVAVDLRRGTGFGNVTSVRLDAATGAAVWIPLGFAHGFQSLDDGTIVNYAVDAPYSPEHDTGILWSSIDFAWPLPAGPISQRDENFVPLDSYDSPFEAAR
jgi:dTDP-4-dehydrorhamnose 3,5-epimerase